MKAATCALSLASWSLAVSLAEASLSCPADHYQTAFLVSDCLERSGQGTDLFVNSSQVQVLAQLPKGQAGARLQLFTSVNVSLLLYDDKVGRCVVGPGCDFTEACPNEATGCITYQGMSIYYSGDDAVGTIDETLRVDGQVTRSLSFRVASSNSGPSQYMYAFGAISPCLGSWSGCSPCSSWSGCLSWQAPQCDGSWSVTCSPSSTTITTTTSTTSLSSTTTTTTSSTATSSTTTTRTSSTTTTTTTTSTTATNTSTTITTATTTTATTTTATTTTTTSTFSCAHGDYLIPASVHCTGHLSTSCFDLPPSCLPCGWYTDCRPLETPVCDGGAVVNCSAALVRLEVATAVRAGAESSSACSASLEVDGAWTPSQTLFASISQGQVVSISFSVSSWPTRVRLAMQGPDSWGLQWMRLALGQRTQYLLQSASPAGWPLGDNAFWIGGPGSPTRNYSVPRDIFLRLEVRTSSQAGAGTTSPLRFSLETAGAWSENRTLFAAAAVGEVVRAEVVAMEWPTRLRIFAGGPDAYGFEAVRLVFRGEERLLLQSAGRRLQAVGGLPTSSVFWLSTVPPAPAVQHFVVPAPQGVPVVPGGSSLQAPTCESGQLQTAALVIGCLGHAGTFAVNLTGGQNTAIAEFPAGAADARVRVWSTAEFDLTLVDSQTSDCIVGSSCLHETACANETDYCIQHDGLRIHFGGNGSANQSLEVVGRFGQPLAFRAVAQTDGVATVTFSYGDLSVCPHPLPGCLPCSAVQSCGAAGPPRCDGGPTVACEGTTTATTTTATLTLTTTSTGTTTRTTTTTVTSTATTTITHTAPPTTTAPVVPTTTTAATTSTATTTTVILAPQAWVVAAWGVCVPTSCGQGLRSRLVSCPGAGRGCGATAPAWQEVCEDYSLCFESPFCFAQNHGGGFSCEAQHWLIIIIIVLLCLCVCGLYVAWCMRVSFVPRRLGQQRQHGLARSWRGSRTKAVGVSDVETSPVGLQERSTSCHLGEGDLKDAEASVDIIHCIGEPPGYFEVLNHRVGGKRQQDADVGKRQQDADVGKRQQDPSPSPTQSLPVDVGMLHVDVAGEAPSPFSAGLSSVLPCGEPPLPPPSLPKEGGDSVRKSNQGDSWDIPVEAISPPTGCEPMRDLHSAPRSRESGDGDARWDHAMSVVDRTTKEISQVMAEVRTAPRRSKPGLFQRLRDLENDPEYLKAKAYLEEDPKLRAEVGKSPGGLLCCIGSAERQLSRQKDSLQAPCSDANVFWSGGDGSEVQEQRSEAYPFAL